MRGTSITDARDEAFDMSADLVVAHIANRIFAPEVEAQARTAGMDSISRHHLEHDFSTA